MLRGLTRHLYPLAVLGGLAVFLSCRAAGGPAALAVTVWCALLLGLCALLERAQPFEPHWLRADADTAADWQSAAVLLAAIEPLLQATLPLLATTLGDLMPPAAAGTLAHGPLGMQVLAAVLWMEFAKYLSHRLHHRWAPLWALHALHHSPQRLYWLNQLRVHPLNHAINSLLSLLPLLMLGIPADALVGALALTQPILMLQHANVRTDNGWINSILSTNEAHRWHHSSDPAEAHANYGSALLIWDHVFGTFRPVIAGGAPRAVGLFDSGHGHPAKASYLRQLAAPFRALVPPCCRPNAA